MNEYVHLCYIWVILVLFSIIVLR